MESRVSGLPEAVLSDSGCPASRLVLRCFISPFFPRSPIQTRPSYAYAPPIEAQRPVLPIVPGFGNFFGTFFARPRFCRLASGNPEGEGVVPNSQAVLQHLPFLRRYA